MTDKPTFLQWFNSDANPLSKASHTAQFFARDALKAAFEAGQEFEKSLHETRRVHHERDDDFSF